MTIERGYNMAKNADNKWTRGGGSGGGGAFLGLGFIGALVYFVQEANGLGEVVVGILKAMVWPAFFVYELFKHVG